jgi:hypothetical protein
MWRREAEARARVPGQRRGQGEEAAVPGAGPRVRERGGRGGGETDDGPQMGQNG